MYMDMHISIYICMHFFFPLAGVEGIRLYFFNPWPHLLNPCQGMKEKIHIHLHMYMYIHMHIYMYMYIHIHPLVGVEEMRLGVEEIQPYFFNPRQGKKMAQGRG